MALPAREHFHILPQSLAISRTLNPRTRTRGCSEDPLNIQKPQPVHNSCTCDDQWSRMMPQPWHHLHRSTLPGPCDELPAGHSQSWRERHAPLLGRCRWGINVQDSQSVSPSGTVSDHGTNQRCLVPPPSRGEGLLTRTQQGPGTIHCSQSQDLAHFGLTGISCVTGKAVSFFVSSSSFSLSLFIHNSPDTPDSRPSTVLLSTNNNNNNTPTV